MRLLYALAVSLPASASCPGMQAWIHVDGTKSMETFIPDRGAYVNSIVEGLHTAASKSFDFGVSVFGDRLPEKAGSQDTCYKTVSEFGATADAVTSFFTSFTSLEDGKDEAEDALSSALYLAANKWPNGSDKKSMNVLVIVTDARSKTEGEGVPASTEGTSDLPNSDVCVTCDNAFKLPSKDSIYSTMKHYDILPVILTKSGASTQYWSKFLSGYNRGGVLVSTGDGSVDKDRIANGLKGFGCQGYSRKGMSGGQIAGAVIGSLAGAALLGGGVYYWWFKPDIKIPESMRKLKPNLKNPFAKKAETAAAATNQPRDLETGDGTQEEEEEEDDDGNWYQDEDGNWYKDEGAWEEGEYDEEEYEEEG